MPDIEPAFCLVQVNGKTCVYQYNKGGPRSQPLTFVAELKDMIDVFRCGMDDFSIPEGG
jgi:hypothetical protein